MTNKEKIKLISFNNHVWEKMKEHIREMDNFLSKQIRTDNTVFLLYNSVKLVVSELMLNEELYSNYILKDYSDEDFVNIVMDSMNKPIPDIDDHQKNIDYIENTRKILWGHIKKYNKKFPALLKALAKTNLEDAHIMTKVEIAIIVECMTVVFVECILRKREMMLLQQTYQ